MLRENRRKVERLITVYLLIKTSFGFVFDLTKTRGQRNGLFGFYLWRERQRRTRVGYSEYLESVICLDGLIW